MALARDVHDGPVQTLAALNMDLDLTRRNVTDPATRKELARIRLDLRKAMQELRDMVGELRSSQLQSVGLSRAIRIHAQEFAEKHPELKLTCRLDPDRGRIGPYGSLALFRIYQEALGNVAKHAHARQVSVGLRFTRRCAILSVRDNGVGMEGPADLMEQTARGHYGLAGMQERAEAVDADLRIRSRPGKGTGVTVSVTLD
jgi:signal transduction histidine kinase